MPGNVTEAPDFGFTVEPDERMNKSFRNKSKSQKTSSILLIFLFKSSPLSANQNSILNQTNIRLLEESFVNPLVDDASDSSSKKDKLRERCLIRDSGTCVVTGENFFSLECAHILKLVYATTWVKLLSLDINVF